jgi:hypothetical protein
MVPYHHRIAPAIALTLTLAAAVPASARFDLNQAAGTPDGGSPTSAAPCSEVCSGSGYTFLGKPAVTSARTGALLPHDPRPRSHVLSGGGSTSGNSITASRDSAAPCSEVCSGSGYGEPTATSTVVRVVAPTEGFHWDDAGIGAGTAFVLTVLLAGGVLGAAKIRRRASPSSAQPTT